MLLFVPAKILGDIHYFSLLLYCTFNVFANLIACNFKYNKKTTFFFFFFFFFSNSTYVTRQETTVFFLNYSKTSHLVSQNLSPPCTGFQIISLVKIIKLYNFLINIHYISSFLCNHQQRGTFSNFQQLFRIILLELGCFLYFSD